MFVELVSTLIVEAESLDAAMKWFDDNVVSLDGVLENPALDVGEALDYEEGS